jgi:periplasmic copper chaperone A
MGNEVWRAGRWAFALGFALLLTAPEAAAIFIVNEPWVLVSPNGRSAEAYMNLTSTEGATLIGVSTEMTKSIEIRPPGTKPKAVTQIKLPAGEKIALAPGAYRFALASLDRPLKLGDRVPMVLTIEAGDGSRTEVPLSAEVRRHSPTYDHKHGHAH